MKRSWVGLAALCAILSLLAWRAFAPPGQSSLPPLFTGEPKNREEVVLDEVWAQAPTAQLAVASKEAPSLGAPALKSPTPSEWWTRFPRTSGDTYWSFTLNPSRVTGEDLLRNSILNPEDIELSRDAVGAFLGYYDEQAKLVSRAREILAEARQNLTGELIRREQLLVVSADSISDRSFRLKNGKTVPGDLLVSKARAVLGKKANDASVSMTALSMAGAFDAGDSVTMAGGRAYYLPFSRVEEGVPTAVSVERSVTLEFVVNVHYWFGGMGVLPNADQLITQLAPRILEGPR